MTDRECETCAKLWRDYRLATLQFDYLDEAKEEAQKNTRDLMHLLYASLRAEEAERRVVQTLQTIKEHLAGTGH